MHAGLVGEDGSRYHLVMSGGKICTKLRSVYEGDGVRALVRSSPKKNYSYAAKRHSGAFWAESRTTELGISGEASNLGQKQAISCN